MKHSLLLMPEVPKGCNRLIFQFFTYLNSFVHPIDLSVTCLLGIHCVMRNALFCKHSHYLMHHEYCRKLCLSVVVITNELSPLVTFILSESLGLSQGSP